MSGITVLNNISSLIAENAVSNTQTSLQNTLQELSTGLKINSGADDPAGLSIADGLGANISALTESSQNASNGVGLLQTADGALSQVTNILNSAVTIATEASVTGLTSSQYSALNNEFNSILSEINQIGSTTNFNGTSVFGGDSSAASSTITPGNSAINQYTPLSAGESYTITSGNGSTFTYTAGSNSTVGDLITAFNNAAQGLATGTTDATVTGTGSFTGASISLSASGQLSLNGLGAGATVTETSTNGSSNVLGNITVGTSPSEVNLTSGTANLAATTTLTANQTYTISEGANSFSFTAGASSTVQDLLTAYQNAQNGQASGTVPPGAAGGATYTSTGTLTGTLELSDAAAGSQSLILSGAPTGATLTAGLGTATDSYAITAANAVAGSTALTDGAQYTITNGNSTFTYTAGADSTVSDLQAAFTAAQGGTATGADASGDGGIYSVTGSTGTAGLAGLSLTVPATGTGALTLSGGTASTSFTDTATTADTVLGGVTNAAGTLTSGTTTLTSASTLTAGAEYQISNAGSTFTYVAGANSTVGDLYTAFEAAKAGGTGGTADADGGIYSVSGGDSGLSSLTFAAPTGVAAALSITGGTAATSFTDSGFTAGAVLGTLTNAATITTAADVTTNTPLASGTTYAITNGNSTFTYTAGSNSTVQDLLTAFTDAQGKTAAVGTATDAIAGNTAGGTYTVTASSGTPATNLSGLALNASATTPGAITLTGASTSATVTVSNPTNPLGTFTSANVYSATAANTTATSAANATLTAGSVTTITDSTTGQSFQFTASSGQTVGDLITAINSSLNQGTGPNQLPAGTTASINANGQLQIADGNSSDILSVTSNDAVLGAFQGNDGTAANNVGVFTSDGTTKGADNTVISIGNLSSGSLGLNGLNLNSATSAQTALTAITNAINSVAAQRGTIGAAVNQLTDDSNVETTEVQNLTSAQNSVQDANIATTTSNLTQYNILEQTGFDALSQAQTAEQNVLKLLQG